MTITVITIVLNGEKFIKDCIESVLNQSYPEIEYIVIDGGSTDGTVDIIRSYKNTITKVISEGDNGISEAFNKGLKNSTGEWIGFLNSDDYYEENAIENLVSYITGMEYHLKKIPCILYGQTNEVDRISGKRSLKGDNRLGWWLRVPFSHCSSFVNRAYIDEYGVFSEEFKIAMDVDFLFRIHAQNLANVHNLKVVLCNQRNGGVSDVRALKGFQEYWKISVGHYGYVISSLSFFLKILLMVRAKFRLWS